MVVAVVQPGNAVRVARIQRGSALEAALRHIDFNRHGMKRKRLEHVRLGRRKFERPDPDPRHDDEIVVGRQRQPRRARVHDTDDGDCDETPDLRHGRLLAKSI